jgi:hypothetical protein
MDPLALKKLIFSISNEHSFEDAALQVFRFQALNNPVYREYIKALKCEVSSVNGLSMIPFLPIDFFKGHSVLSNESGYEIVFTSSGTTNTQPSKHYVSDVLLYRESFMRTFKQFYGPPADYAILALLPSYLEREGSSLVYMVDHLIRESKNPHSGFYLYNLDQLVVKIKKLKHEKQKFMLWGVTFALLELAEKYDLDLGNAIVIETGGMKGKRAELTREELHRNLCERFHLVSIHSEYGMTELLSQAYSKGLGIFQTPPWMKIIIRDMNDPLVTIAENSVGGINVIDLANIHSCSFIATQDLGRLSYEGTFEVLGRFDNSDVRGCNLMVV